MVVWIRQKSIPINWIMLDHRRWWPINFNRISTISVHWRTRSVFWKPMKNRMASIDNFLMTFENPTSVLFFFDFSCSHLFPVLFSVCFANRCCYCCCCSRPDTVINIFLLLLLVSFSCYHIRYIQSKKSKTDDWSLMIERVQTGIRSIILQFDLLQLCSVGDGCVAIAVIQTDILFVVTIVVAFPDIVIAFAFPPRA